MTDPAAIPFAYDYLARIVIWCARMSAAHADCLKLKTLFAETFEEERARVRLAEAVKAAERFEI